MKINQSISATFAKQIRMENIGFVLIVTLGRKVGFVLIVFPGKVNFLKYIESI